MAEVDYFDSWDSKKFFEELLKLDSVEGNIVINTLMRMEHRLTLSEIEIERGIKIAATEKGWTLNELIKELYKKIGYNCKESFKSMLKRNYVNSRLLPDVLEILEIDEGYLIRNSSFFHIDVNDNTEEAIIEQQRRFFDTLSDNDRRAICYLVHSLLHKDETAQFLETLTKTHNAGVEPIT